MFWSKSKKTRHAERELSARAVMPVVEALEDRRCLSTTIMIGAVSCPNPTENQPFTNNTIAIVAAYDAQNKAITDLSGFSAAIDWGDGTKASSGTIANNVGGDYYQIDGSHTYQKAGTYPISVDVTAPDGTSVNRAVGLEQVDDAPLASTPKLITCTAGESFTKTLAELTDSNSGSSDADFTADIYWGDGTPQNDPGQIVSLGSGQYQVIGTHTYANPGTYYADIYIKDISGSTSDATVLVQVAPATSGNPGGSTGGNPGGSTGSNPGGSTGNSPGGSTGSNPGGSTGGSPGGSTGSNPGGSTGGSPGGSTGGNPGGSTGETGPLAWGDSVSPQFKAEVVQIASELGADPNNLMAAMAFETGRTFSPSIRNKVSGAVGLIQFMPSTAKRLHTSSAALAKMSAVQQLQYVEKYLAPYAGRLNSVSDVYMAILWPKAVGQSDNYVLFSQGSLAYTQNKGLDTNHDGQVTKAEAAGRVQGMLQMGMAPPYYG